VEVAWVLVLLLVAVTVATSVLLLVGVWELELAHVLVLE
jgi:hypothetical protein